MDRGTVRKHVEFYSKNKFEKLVHLVGFIARIYHDTWSPERQIHFKSYGIPFTPVSTSHNLKYRCMQYEILRIFVDSCNKIKVQ